MTLHGAGLVPAHLDADGWDTICASCHTRGHDRTGEFRYPAGYAAGEDLTVYFKGLIPKKGQEEGTFKGDGSLLDRLRSLRYWAERYLVRRGVNCSLCKSFRSAVDSGQEVPEDLPDLSLAEYCLTCHDRIRGEKALHQADAGTGTDCYSCHEPMRDSSGNTSIHDHKFVFTRALERAAR